MFRLLRSFIPFFRQRRSRSITMQIWHSWLFDLNDASRALFIASLLAIFFGSHTTNIDVFVFLGFLAAFLTLALCLAGLMRPRVKLSHSLPQRAVCEETLSFSASVLNLSRWKTWDVVVHPARRSEFWEIFPKQQWIEALSGKEMREVSFKIKFKKRGSYVFGGLRADSTFPCGLFRVGRGRQGEEQIIVYPWFAPLSKLHIPTGRRYQPGGVALASELGDSLEYIGNREYVEGDDLRKIDWRSWARLGIPIVREYQEEYFCRVALILDTQLLSKKADDLRRFEDSLSMAASVADYLSRQEYIVDIFAAGPQVHILEAGRSLAHLEQILEVLACLDPCREDPFALIEPAIVERISTLTTAIVILLEMDSVRLAFVKTLRSLGIGLKVLVCNDKFSPDLENSYNDSFEIHRISPERIRNGIDVL